MSDGGRDRASLAVGMWKSSQKWNVQRSAVRSIAWLDDWRDNTSSLLFPNSIQGLSIFLRRLGWRPIVGDEVALHGNLYGNVAE
jgi:hypothetical protein